MQERSGAELMELRTDPSIIQRALGLILEPGQITEIRAFGGKKPLGFGYFDTDHLADLARAAATFQNRGASGIYFIPNVINPALLARAANRARDARDMEATKDGDIQRRRWLLIDCDPVRPAGISSTDEEHEAALTRCREIRAGLKAEGWPAPILADSGNGGHLLYRVDLPADDGGLVERILASLRMRWSDDVVDVDRTVKNASRVWKLYGTLARKGDATPDRPHRMATILSAPTDLVAVESDRLEAFAAEAKVPLPSPPPSAAPRLTSGSQGEGEPQPGNQELQDRRIRAEVERFDPAVEGSGGDRTTFRHCCVLVKEWGLEPEVALDYLRPWNARCVPPWTEEDLLRKLQHAKRYGRKPEGTRQLEPTKGGGTSNKKRDRQVSAPGHDAADLPTPPPGREEPIPGPREPENPASPTEARDAAGEGGKDAQEPAPEGLRPFQVWDHLIFRTTEEGTRKLQRWGGNLAKILRFDARWGIRLQLDEMTQDILFDGAAVDETFADQVQEMIEETYNASFGAEEILRKVRAQAQAHPIHPVREWLRSLPEWDGVERLQHVPSDFLEAEDPLSGHLFRHWAIGAVRRVMRPGCKMDVAFVLVGQQGKRKSTFWNTLAGDRWFSDTPVDLDSKDRFQQLASAWIVELPEIDWQTYAKTAEALKAFLSSRVDRYRPPYGKAVLTVRRTSVCVGSTNRQEFLTDPTGSRRFWPVPVPDDLLIDIERLAEVRDQLWAEALVLEAQDVPHWLSPELEALRSTYAEQFTAEDTWDALAEKALEQLKEERTKANKSIQDGFTTAEILMEMGLPPHQHSRQATNRVKDAMRRLRWDSRQVQMDGIRRWRWCPRLPRLGE
jgi:hypothetical protein